MFPLATVFNQDIAHIQLPPLCVLYLGETLPLIAGAPFWLSIDIEFLIRVGRHLEEFIGSVCIL